MNPSISVFGIGKLGLPLAASLARKGYRVIGVDLNQKVIQAVNEGRRWPLRGAKPGELIRLTYQPKWDVVEKSAAIPC